MSSDEPQEPFLFRGDRFQVQRATWESADGGRHQRDVIRHPGAVTILPLVDADHVCLIRNYRVAVGQTLWELPAGTRDPGEQPIDTARRELQEETGYRAGRLEPLHTFFLSPGILDERMELFLATQLIPGEAAREATEQITNQVTPWADAIGMVRDGTIRDAKTIAGLLLYDAIRGGSAPPISQ